MLTINIVKYITIPTYGINNININKMGIIKFDIVKNKCQKPNPSCFIIK